MNKLDSEGRFGSIVIVVLALMVIGLASVKLLTQSNHPERQYTTITIRDSRTHKVVNRVKNVPMDSIEDKNNKITYEVDGHKFITSLDGLTADYDTNW